MIKYEVEGETNMPFKLSKIIVVGTVEGVEKNESKKKWDFSIYQNNDIHFYIDQNKENTQDLLIKSIKRSIIIHLSHSLCTLPIFFLHNLKIL